MHPLIDTGRGPCACTVSAFESIRASPSRSSCGIMSEKHTRYHVRFCKRSILASLVRSFPLESIWIFRPLGCFDRHCTKKKCGLIACCACTVSGVNAIRAIPSQSKHGIMSDFCKRSILASLVRSFSSRVDLDLQASRMFRPTLHEKKCGLIACCRTLSGL